MNRADAEETIVYEKMDVHMMEKRPALYASMRATVWKDLLCDKKLPIQWSIGEEGTTVKVVRSNNTKEIANSFDKLCYFIEKKVVPLADRTKCFNSQKQKKVRIVVS